MIGAFYELNHWEMIIMTNVLDFSGKPSLFSAYLNIFSPGRSKYKGLDSIPQLEARWANAKDTPEKIQAYREVCGFANDGHLPILYPHVLTSAMHINMLADKRFPVSALGAVHARTHILQRRPIAESETVDLCCRFSDKRVLKAGLEVDITTIVLAGGEPIWESVNAYLFRGKKFGAVGDPHPWTQFDEASPPTIESTWHVPSNMGKRYAKITGDYNPIHVSRILAKAFGFKRDIIHGFWSLGRGLSLLPDFAYDAPSRLDAAFKGPIFMDSDTALKAHETDEGGFRFDMFCGKNPRPCITGTLRHIPADAALSEDAQQG
jgi:hypothetical protein